MCNYHWIYSELHYKIESKTMDVYTETTIRLMKEKEFDRYLKLMVESEIPKSNQIHLVYSKVKDFEEEAKQIVLKAAAKRKELEELERKYNV